jgi:hypothetical protein
MPFDINTMPGKPPSLVVVRPRMRSRLGSPGDADVSVAIWVLKLSVLAVTAPPPLTLVQP